MKAALKHKIVYILAPILAIVGVGVPFGILAITLIPSLNAPTFHYPYLLWIFAIGYFLIGFIWCDIQVAFWRKNNQQWDGPADPLVLEKGWVARWILWLAGILVFIVCIVFEIICLVSGAYPFL